MKTIILIFALGIMSMMMACDDESALRPSDKPENVYGGYLLPQGNHEYDTRIVNYFEKYNTVILYKFDEKEFWWSQTFDVRWKYDSVENKTTAGYEMASADTLYVGEQLTLIQDKFFSHFPDELLNRNLPLKTLLVGGLKYVKALTRYPTEADWSLVNAYSGYDYLCINWANEDVKSMTPAQINQFKSDVCYTFLKRLFDTGVMPYSMEFVGVSNYTQSVNQNTKYQYGFLDHLNKTMNADWSNYIKMCVENPYEKLIATGGYLHSGVDTRGLIKKKYDIMVNHFKNTYNIDLQAIGNDFVE